MAELVLYDVESSGAKEECWPVSVQTTPVSGITLKATLEIAIWILFC